MKCFRLFEENSLPVMVVRIDKQTHMYMHSHEFHEMVIVSDGTGMHCTDTERYPIERGDVFLIKPGCSHAYEDTAGLNIINLLYIPEKLGLPLYDLIDVPGFHAFFELEPALRSQHGFKSRLRISNEKLDYISSMIKLLEDEINSGRKGRLYAAASVLMQIILFVSRSYDKSSSPAQTEIFRLGEALSYIGMNFRRDISLAKLARKAAMSETTLYRMFKKSFGVSPVNYVISLRVAHARKLLESTDMTVSDIANDSGFGDSNFFSRTFRRHVGMSPRDYRKRFGYNIKL